MSHALKGLIIQALDPDIFEAIGNGLKSGVKLGSVIPDIHVLAALQLQLLRAAKAAAWCAEEIRSEGVTAWTR